MKAATDLPHVHLITGPTGAGKTAIATQLAAAQDAPVVVADRIQCYVDMPTTSARFTGREGPPRHHLSDRVVPDGDYPPNDATQALLNRVQSLARRHRYVVVEGGSISLLRAFADRRERFPFQFTAQVLHMGDPAAHLERLRTRAAQMLDGMLEEFAQAWQHTGQRPFVASIVGWATLVQWCRHNRVHPKELARIDRGGPEIFEITERVAQACAEHSHKQDAAFTRLFENRSMFEERASAPPPDQAARPHADDDGRSCPMAIDAR